jgi:hypothetical protein
VIASAGQQDPVGSSTLTATGTPVVAGQKDPIGTSSITGTGTISSAGLNGETLTVEANLMLLCE